MANLTYFQANFAKVNFGFGQTNTGVGGFKMIQMVLDAVVHKFLGGFGFEVTLGTLEKEEIGEVTNFPRIGEFSHLKK